MLQLLRQLLQYCSRDGLQVTQTNGRMGMWYLACSAHCTPQGWAAQVCWGCATRCNHVQPCFTFKRAAERTRSWA